MKTRLPLLLMLMFLSSCGDRIIYYGRSYPATQTVDIFFRESDVVEPNEIMGKATLEVSAKKNSDKVQRKLMDRAKRKGADALIFDDISLTTTGSTTGAAAAGTSGRRGFLGIFGSKTKFSKGQQVKATLLKYKKNVR
ncbi:MAG: hypothetical protein K2U26_20220 [Cyclobacteriaceae bacterium]|nr:hypothetical protein [Cyclobacteriaceae bacterium]